MIDFISQLDPAVLAALIGLFAIPAVHDLVVAWAAEPQVKATVSALLAVAVGLAVPGLKDVGLDDTAVLESILAAYIGKEAGFRGFHEPLGKKAGKPTVFATAETFGIGGNGMGLPGSSAASIEEGD